MELSRARRTLVGGRQSFISWGAIGAFGGFLMPPVYLIAGEVPAIVGLYLRHAGVNLVPVMLWSGSVFTLFMIV